MSVARIEEAFLLADRGETAPAADVLERVIAAAPGYAPAYVLHARLCETLHRWPQALARWQDAALLMPTLDVAREGVLRATRVIAALQALDARTAVLAEPPPRTAEAAAPPPPRAEPSSSDDPPPAAGALRTGEQEPQPLPAPIRLGGGVPRPETEPDALPSTAPPLEPADEEDAAAEEPAAEEEPPPATPPRRSLPGASFDAPPPPPDTFVRDSERLPEAAAPGGPSSFGDLDLDALIDQLNTQGRIRPREDIDRVPAPDLNDDIEDMVSETLARIYATQKQFDEAARIYELLAAQQPEEAEEFMARAADMRARAGDG